MNQSILASVLKEELLRNQQKQKYFLKELNHQNKLYISKKIIKGKMYLYFQVRNGKKIESKYIGRYSNEKLQEAIKSIEKRNQLYQDYQFLKKEEKILKRAINSYDK
jgi:ribonuclease HII